MSQQPHKKIYWDATKTGNPRYPASGMKQVANRLFAELEATCWDIRQVYWHKRAQHFFDSKTKMPILEEAPLITPEIFSESGRQGILDWLKQYKGHKIAIFYDAIPLRFPEITWPQSVARHPEYMKMLGTHFDQVLSISEASQEELHNYWNWLELKNRPITQPLQLGADLHFQLRYTNLDKEVKPPWQLIMVGILEPRKNHLLAIEACEKLHAEGIHLHLHIAGRLNPHFGDPIHERIMDAQRKGLPITWHKSPEKNFVLKLYRTSHLCLFPSMAEGCGLPVLESLWMGTPVLAANIPSVLENANYGGVQLFEGNQGNDFENKLRNLLKVPSSLQTLTQQAQQAKLPVWRNTARQLRSMIPDLDE